MRLTRLFSTLALAFTLSLASLRAAEDLTTLTLAEAAARIRSGSVTSVQLTEACLARIAIYDPKLDAFITVMKDQALAQAKQLDAEAKAGKFRGPLHGVPIALKDNVDTANARTTGGSALFAERLPAEDAPIVTRMVAAGAVIIGKTNLQEFAMGGGESSPTGRSAPTPAARSVCRLRSPALSATSPPTALCRSAASSRCA
jgi:aspartyl-tRNA(Asn)/glutamyl-tRNA(Gln) amidotransferase subunit A